MKTTFKKSMSIFGPMLFSLIPVIIGAFNLMNLHFSNGLGFVILALTSYNAYLKLSDNCEKEILDPFYDNREYDMPALLIITLGSIIFAAMSFGFMF